MAGAGLVLGSGAGDERVPQARKGLPGEQEDGPDRGWVTSLGEVVAATDRWGLVLLGVGNPIKSDDSVGLYIAGRLKRAIGSRLSPGVRVIVSPRYPELAISRVDLRSSKLLIFDAVEARREPGSVVFACIGDTKYGFFATHNLPLRLHPAVRESGKNVFVLGVQPADLGIGERLSPTVLPVAQRVVGEVARQLEAGRRPKQEKEEEQGEEKQ